MSATEPPQPQPSAATALRGRWARVTDPPPAAEAETVAFGQDASQLPAEIEFREGTYRGTKGPDQRFVVWDAGTYSVEEGRLSISLANDAIETYPLQVGGEKFTVADALGRQTTYRRQADGGSG